MHIRRGPEWSRWSRLHEAEVGKNPMPVRKLKDVFGRSIAMYEAVGMAVHERSADRAQNASELSPIARVIPAELRKRPDCQRHRVPAKRTIDLKDWHHVRVIKPLQRIYFAAKTIDSEGPALGNLDSRYPAGPAVNPEIDPGHTSFAYHASQLIGAIRKRHSRSMVLPPRNPAVGSAA